MPLRIGFPGLDGQDRGVVNGKGHLENALKGDARIDFRSERVDSALIGGLCRSMCSDVTWAPNLANLSACALSSVPIRFHRAEGRGNTFQKRRAAPATICT